MRAPRPLIEIWWTDANSSHGWTDWSELGALSPSPCCTVGYLLFETPNYVTVAGSLDLCLDGDKVNPVNAACGSISIPKKMIVRRRVLKK